jgi:uncharacterized protein YdiU (UPF0061 family)
MFSLPNSYLNLPPIFYKRIDPTPVTTPSLVVLNEPLADYLGLSVNVLLSPEALSVFAGNSVPSGAQPLALAYSGHQFGHFVPVLGDGRAVLLGEIHTITHGAFDVQLKGSGKTPFSRRGDGRAALGPMMREYIIGEALHALGIPATRTLAVVATGETVMRERPLPGGIQTRIARSHIRVGTFQYAASHGDKHSLQALADYVIARHYPELTASSDRYFELAQAVIARQATLIAQWMHVGFIHGVMNTDNVAISGESIDFGPCAFMNRYDPNTVFSSIDQHGRYAYGAQPGIIQWNVARLAEALAPLFDDDADRAISRAQELVDSFPSLFAARWYTGMRDKLGLLNVEREDNAMIKELLEAMYQAKVDYTATFRALSGDPSFVVPEALHPWHFKWLARIDSERNRCPVEETRGNMRRVNPAVIARNHLVEEALQRGVEHGDFSFMRELVDALRDPYTAQAKFSVAPLKEDSDYRTFCGT